MRTVLDIENDLDAREPQADSWIVDVAILAAIGLVSCWLFWSVLT